MGCRQIDSVAGKRAEGGSDGSDTGGPGVRLLSALLTEMDGLELATGVMVVGATNKPSALDSALVRPGRFDVVLFVPPPDAAGRLEALQIHSRGIPLHVGTNQCPETQNQASCPGCNIPFPSIFAWSRIWSIWIYLPCDSSCAYKI